MHDLLHAVAGGRHHRDRVRRAVGDIGTAGSRRTCLSSPLILSIDPRAPVCPYRPQCGASVARRQKTLFFIQLSVCRHSHSLYERVHPTSRSNRSLCKLCTYFGKFAVMFYALRQPPLNVLLQFIGYILVLMSAASAFFAYRTWNRTKKGSHSVVV